MVEGRSPRPYRKVARAQREAETRRRITEAAVELHETVGPASTRITDVAKTAGVSRMTVYSHFGTEAELFRACSMHWSEQHPFPDPSRWSTVNPAIDRLQPALLELYGWYADNRGMLGMVFRDLGAVPALAEVMQELWVPYMEQWVQVLTSGWPVSGTEVTSLASAIRWVLEFASWQTLTQSGLTDEEAAALASRVVTSAFYCD